MCFLDNIARKALVLFGQDCEKSTRAFFDNIARKALVLFGQHCEKSTCAFFVNIPEKHKSTSELPCGFVWFTYEKLVCLLPLY
jgi:hypothetical protein